MSKAFIVSRPALTVVTEHTSYDANQLSLATHDGRWCLTFLSSGGLVVIPAADVKEVRFAGNGAQWCMSCDERLKAWVDPSYAREIQIED